MSKLSAVEQKAVTDLKTAYSNLSTEAKAEVAQAVSWAEKHFWPWTIGVAVIFTALGLALGHG